MVLFAMIILQGMESDCMAQTTRRTITKETYVEEVFHEGTSQLLETRIWDSFNDYKIGKELKTSDGWICGWGEATGNIYDREVAGRDLKRTAQNAAYDQIAGQMEREIVAYHKDRRVIGTHNGRKIEDQISDEGFQSKIKGRLPSASKSCSYRINRKNGTVTVVVGIGIDMKSYEAIKKGFCTEEESRSQLKGLDDAFDF